jgi:prepilin-type N-terminal cleavage/methylation domain-containing protein
MRDSRGFTLIELLMVIVVVAILSSFALVAYRNARLKADEASAISDLESINQAQFAFFHTCGHDRYSATLPGLGMPVPNGTAFLSPDLTQADQITKSGYVIQMGGTADLEVSQTCSGAQAVAGYQVTADPLVPGTTGGRFFGSNTERAIYEDAATFTGNMPETGPPPHGTEVPPS